VIAAQYGWPQRSGGPPSTGQRPPAREPHRNMPPQGTTSPQNDEMVYWTKDELAKYLAEPPDLSAPGGKKS
jgi:hypothetical protein